MRLRDLRKQIEQIVATSGGGGAAPTGLMHGELYALVPAGYKFIVMLDSDVPGENDPTFLPAIETPIVDGVPDYPRAVATQTGYVGAQVFTSFPTELVEVRIPVRCSYAAGESGSGTLRLREPDFGAFHTVDQIAFGVNP